MSTVLTSAYSGQPIGHPGDPAVGDVWINSCGGGVIRVLAVEGGEVKYERQVDGPGGRMSVDWLLRTATRKYRGAAA